MNHCQKIETYSLDEINNEINVLRQLRYKLNTQKKHTVLSLRKLIAQRKIIKLDIKRIVHDSKQPQHTSDSNTPLQ